MNRNHDILIIGAGPAGLTAALYAKRYGHNPLVIERQLYGGQLISTPQVENYPGFKNITGIDLAMSLYEQITELGVEVKFEEITSVFLEDEEKIIKTNSDEYSPEVVIIANGAKRRKLNCIGEAELAGYGVSYCATCDGVFYKNKEVVIVGGGNTALEDALFLSNLCTKVHIIHRRDEFRGNNILVNAVLKKDNINICYDSTINSIHGDKKVSSIVLENIKTSVKTELSVEGVFVAIGLEPDNTIFDAQITLNKDGYIVAGEDCKTNVKGVFVAGDSRTKLLRQIVTAVSDGAVAAFESANLLNLN